MIKITGFSSSRGKDKLPALTGQEGFSASADVYFFSYIYFEQNISAF